MKSREGYRESSGVPEKVCMNNRIRMSGKGKMDRENTARIGKGY
jgi:hypothetical protein